MPVGVRGGGYIIRFNPGTVPSQMALMSALMYQNLLITLPPVIDSIIKVAQDMLKELPADHVVYDNRMGGRDTGRMAESLTKQLTDQLRTHVIYRLYSTEADYWQYIEWGHFVFTGKGPRWWEGYHFFEKATEFHWDAIAAAARAAWHLSAEQARAAAGHAPLPATSWAHGMDQTLIGALSASEQGG